MSALLFWLVAILATSSALGMILGRNATHSVLLAVVSFSMLALLYLGLGSPFLAAVQIIVYAGAILILFLFVVMLMGNDPGPLWEQIPLQRLWALLFTGLLIVGLISTLNLDNVTGQRGPFAGVSQNTPRELAVLFFERYVLPLEVTALVLLAAMIGAIVLAKRDAYRTPREDALHLDDVM